MQLLNSFVKLHIVQPHDDHTCIRIDRVHVLDLVAFFIVVRLVDADCIHTEDSAPVRVA